MDQASEHIKGHYKVVGVEPGEVIPRDGKKVDLRTISLARANELYEAGFPFLKKIKSSDSNDEKKKVEGNEKSGTDANSATKEEKDKSSAGNEKSGSKK